MSLDDANMLGSSTEPSTGMQLDTRQRAMLEAMGITVWQSAPLVDKRPVAQHNTAGTATKNVAYSEPITARSSPTTPGYAAPTQGNLPAAVPGIGDGSAPLSTPVSASFSATPPAPSHATPPRISAAAATRASASPVTLHPLPEGIAHMDWQQLQSAVSTCQACALCEGRKNTVFGTGQASTGPALAPRADWLIVGEAPSETEDAQGEPFVGEAGKLLDNMLRAMLVDGQPLSRQRNVFISNVLKCRPVADRNPSSAEVAMCQPYLLRQIALLQPKIILAMGRFAVQALTGSNEPLGKLRGRVHALQGGGYAAPVVVTYHPAYLLRNLPDKAKAWADLLLAMETLAALDKAIG
jgi:uracil-DNA glycosylase